MHDAIGRRSKRRAGHMLLIIFASRVYAGIAKLGRQPVARQPAGRPVTFSIVLTSSSTENGLLRNAADPDSNDF